MPIGNLTRLQRAHLPNIPVLKGLIAWFDAVSEFLDDFFTTEPTFIAGAQVDTNIIIGQYGILGPVAHPSAGIYNFTLNDAVVTPSSYILSASLGALTVADTVLYDIGVQLVGSNVVRVRVYSLADTAAPTIPIPADHAFYFEMKKLPGLPA